MADLASLAQQPQNQLFAVSAKPKFVSVNSNKIVFPNSQSQPCTRTLTIVNNHAGRITWRVLSNATSRYVVSPNKGFLTAQEQIRVEVTLVAGCKYNYRQALLVQAKVALPNENNRKLVWEKEDSSPVHSIKITTLMDGVKVPSPLSAAASSTTVNSASGSVSGASLESSPTSGASLSTISSSSGSSVSSLASLTEKDHGEFKAKVEELEARIRKKIEEKDLVTTRLIGAVNDVKKLEVELDRAGNEVAKLQHVQHTLAAKNKVLKEQVDSMKKELQDCPKGAPRRSA